MECFINGSICKSNYKNKMQINCANCKRQLLCQCQNPIRLNNWCEGNTQSPVLARIVSDIELIGHSESIGYNKTWLQF